jgi:hypothetical protein
VGFYETILFRYATYGFKIIISRGKMSMACIKGIKYKMEYTSVHFNFKTKKVEFDKEMTAEIILNDL